MAELVPELHDVLKLTILQHDLSDFERFEPYRPKTRTWDGVVRHHLGEKYNEFPFDRETFLLCFSDSQASRIGRHLEGIYIDQVGKLPEGIRLKPFTAKLWKHPGTTAGDPRLTNDADIISLLQFLDSNPSFDEFKDRYLDILLLRPEEMTIGRNVTSLLSHMVLTGKLYRILQRSQPDLLKDVQIRADRDYLLRITDKTEKKWKIFLTQIKFEFFQNPFRSRDFWVFDLLQEAMDEIVSRFPDNLLMRFENQLLLIYDDPQLVNEIVSSVPGFLLTTVSIRGTFPEIKFPDPNNPPRGLKKIGPQPNYPDLPEIIEPPLCEICQMEKAEKVWPDDYLAEHGREAGEEERREELCSACFDIRRRPSRLKKFTNWSESGNVLVAWVRRSLQYSRLVDSLTELYWRYLQTFIPKISREEAHIRFSLIEEFSRDYQAFVQDFNQAVISRFFEDNVESLTDWFCCVQLKHRREVFNILEIYQEILTRHFPTLKDLPSSPFSLGIAVCPANFPFFQVWRQLQNPAIEILVLLLGHGPLVTDNRHLEALLVASRTHYPKSALHGLAEVAKISEALALVKFADRGQKRDFSVYQKLNAAVEPLGMDFRSLLTLAQLLED